MTPTVDLTLTANAAARLHALSAKAGAPVLLRVAVDGGGCSGFTYVLDFDQNGPTEFDLAFQQHGVNVVVDKKSEFFMGGTILDFNDGLLAETCRHHGWKLVTNDSDFTTGGIEVLTSHPALLRACS